MPVADPFSLNDQTTPAPVDPTPPSPPPIQAADFESAAKGLYFKSLGDRAAIMHPEFLNQFPLAAAHMATSAMPSQTVENISKTFPTHANWVFQQDSFAGEPGKLTQVRLRALGIQDPEMRFRALQTLNAFNSASPEDQQVLKAYMDHPELFTGNQALGFRGALPEQGSTATGEGAAAALNTMGLTGATFNPGTGDINISAEQGDNTPAEVAAIETLLPNLKGKIHFDEGGISLNDIKDSYANLSVFQPVTADLSQPGKSVTQRLLDIGSVYLGTGLQGMGAPVVAAGDALGWGAWKAIHYGVDNPLTSHFISKDAQIQAYGYIARGGTAVADAANRQMARAQNDLGYAFAKASGAKEGTQEFKTRQALYGGVVLAVLFHGASEYAGAASIAGGELPEGAAGRLGLVTTPGTPPGEPIDIGGVPGEATPGTPPTAKPLASVAAAFEKGGKNLPEQIGNAALHPLATAMDPIIKALAFNANAVTPEGYWTSGLADPVINQVLKYGEEDPATAAARAHVRYGGTVDPAIVQTILDAGNHDQAVQNITDMYNSKGRNVTQLEELRAQRAENAKAQATYETRQANASGTIGTIDQHGLPAPEPNWLWHVTTSDAAQSITDGVMEARGLFGDVPPDQVPNTPEARPASYWATDPARAMELSKFDPNVDQNLTYFAIDRNDVTAIPSAYKDGEFLTRTNLDPSKMKVMGSDGTMVPADSIALGDPYKGLDLQAQGLALQARIDELAHQTLESYKYPTNANLKGFAHQAFYDPQTPFEKVFNKIINPGRYIKEWSNKVFDTNLNTNETPVLAKFFDKLPNTPELINTTRGREPGDLISNAKTIEYIGKKLNFSNDEIVQTISNFENAQSPQEYFQALKDFGARMDSHLPSDTPLAVRKGITTFYDRSGSDYQMRYPVGNGATEPLVPGPNGENLPSLPNEFLGQRVKLPSMELIDSATSMMKRIEGRAFNDTLTPAQIRIRARNYVEATGVDYETAVERIVQTQGSGKAVQAGVLAYQTANIAMSMARLTLKPLDLAFRIPAIVMKKTIDEAIGNAATPNMAGNIRPMWDDVSNILGPDVRDQAMIPNILSDAMDHVNDRRIVEDVSTRSLVADGSIDNQGTWTGTVRRLQFLNNDEFARRFVQLDLNVADMKQALTGGDPHLTDVFDRNTASSLQTAGMSLDTWLNRLKTTIQGNTLSGDPEMLNFIRSGAISMDGNLSSDQVWQYQNAVAENTSIESRLNDLSAGDPMRSVLQNKMRENLNLLDQLTQEAGGKVDIQKITNGQEKALANYFIKRYQDGSLTLPDSMPIDRWANSDVGGLGSLSERAQEAASSFSSWAYSKLRYVGDWEAKLARGNFFEQRAYQEYQSLIAGGMPDAQAKATAIQTALDQTRDVFYDLAARSSAERGIRNAFWYAPVQGELMYRWLYAIPAEQGNAAFGLALNATKALNYFTLFRQLNIIQKDPVSGAYVTPIPGIAGLVSGISQHLPGPFKIRIPSELEVPLGSLTHLSFDAPALSGPLGMALGAAAQQFGGPFKTLANIVQPFGSLTNVWPSAIKYGAEAFGWRLPDLYPGANIQQYDRVHDQARQFAYEDITTHGHPQPMTASYINADGTFDRNAYMAAWTKWNDLLEEETNQYAKGMFLVHSIQSSIFPGQIEATTPEKQAYQNFLVNKVLPQYAKGSLTPEEQAAVSAQFDKWLREHPNSLAFSISYNYYTGKKWTPPSVDTSDQYWRDEYLNHIKDVYTPDDYAQVLPALVSKAHYDAQVNGALQQIAPNSLGPNQAPTLLENWGQRRVVLANAAKDWQTYLNAHAEAGPIIALAQARMAKARGYATEGEGLQNIQAMLNAGTQLAPLFTGVSGMPSQEYQTVMGKLRAAEAKAYASGNLSAPTTPLEKDIAWYMGQLSKYNDATKPLYDQATQLQDAGLDATSVYNQINQIKAQYNNLSHNGVAYPPIDQFYFGSKTGPEQQYALINWATKPVSWMSDWQRQKLGYASFTGEDQMWTDIQNMKAQYAPELAALPPTSSQAAALKNFINLQENQIASKYGAAGVAAVNLDNALPYVRLNSTGFGAGNASWTSITNEVNLINEQLTAQGDSIRGYSAAAQTYKLYIYSQIAQAEQTNPQFKALMTKLSYAIPSSSSPGEQRTGVPLYEAVFFGQFTYQFIPKNLLAAYNPSSGGV